MIWNVLVVTVLSPMAILAAPLMKRAADDTGILKFLNVVEQFDNALYTQMLAKFTEHDFAEAGYSSTQVPKKIIQKIMKDDTAHASLLADGLGGQALQTCKFKFDSVLTDVKSAMETARVFEEVAVAAFTGADLLLQDVNFRVAAASIVTNEARHQSVLNVLNGGSDIPQSFGVALRPEQALSVLSPFISDCDIGIPATKPLKLKSRLQAGVPMKFDMTNLPTNKRLFCQIMVGGQPLALSEPLETCTFPVDNVDGPVYMFVTDDAHPIASNILSQNHASILAGPAVAFVDKQEAVLSKLVLHNGLHGHQKAARQDIKVVGVQHRLARVLPENKGNKMKE
ncbi:hypothetical protein M408DRAFT_327572 [Serendipita vermifera MAFF 305830]|uniref:Ferritin/DPS protein domain-containing protein n=1 Tax=Serendipita vermifera MAFF 305830 TaxID=933852 RepID=A0A0C3BGN3_SERVB|nr:hypothetical protein M408DRAFT_327572 [Serendipita vermifera MAFF 305830]